MSLAMVASQAKEDNVKYFGHHQSNIFIGTNYSFVEVRLITFTKPTRFPTALCIANDATFECSISPHAKTSATFRASPPATIYT